MKPVIAHTLHIDSRKLPIQHFNSLFLLSPSIAWGNETGKGKNFILVPFPMCLRLWAFHSFHCEFVLLSYFSNIEEISSASFPLSFSLENFNNNFYFFVFTIELKTSRVRTYSEFDVWGVKARKMIFSKKKIEAFYFVNCVSFIVSSYPSHPTSSSSPPPTKQ